MLLFRWQQAYACTHALLHTDTIFLEILCCSVALLLTVVWLYISVQHECIPQAILSMDVLCQAKSGMGKTAVFVLATLQQLEPVDGQVSRCWPL